MCRDDDRVRTALRTRTLLWLAALGLVIRWIYFTEHAGSAFFGVPVLDEKYYDTVARILAAGGSVSEINPGFRPLLYPLFLAAGYRVAGEWGPALTIGGQHLLGIATALLAAAVAARLYRRSSVGVTAGVLYLLAGVPLYFEGELLITSLFTFLATLVLAAWTRLDHETPARGWFGAGLLTALAAQARPNILSVLPALPLVAVVWKNARRRRFSLAVGSLAGCLAGLALFGALHAPWTGHVQLLGGSGGVNFYLGNKRGADGMVPRQDRPVTYGAEYRDSVQVFAEEVFRESTGMAEGSPAAISRFWLGRGLEEIASDPNAWLALMARKVSYLVWNGEIPNNKSFAFVREHESVVLRLSPVGWAWLFALAPLGAVAAGRRGDRRILVMVGLFIAFYAAGVLLFFVNSRYRAPLWPAMAVLAAGGIFVLVDALRGRHLRALAGGLAAAVLLASVSWVNWFDATPPSYARDFFFRSIARLEKGELEGAAGDARRSLELDPRDAAAHFQLGTVALARDDPEQALASFRRAAELQPGETRVWHNLGVTLERLGRAGQAHLFYLRALRLAENYAPALVNAALLELRAGRVDDAERRVRRAEELGYESVSLACARAFVERARGRLEPFLRALAEAAQRDAEAVRRLMEENAVAVTLEASER